MRNYILLLKQKHFEISLRPLFSVEKKLKRYSSYSFHPISAKKYWGIQAIAFLCKWSTYKLCTFCNVNMGSQWENPEIWNIS